MCVRSCIKAPSFQNKGEYSFCKAFPYYNKKPFATAGLEAACKQYVRAANAAPKRSAEQTGQQGHKSDADQSNAAASHQLFHTQIGVGNRLDGGRRRVKKYLWSFFRTAPAGQVRL